MNPFLGDVYLAMMEVGDTSFRNWTTSLRTKKKNNRTVVGLKVSSVVTRDQFGQAKKNVVFFIFSRILVLCFWDKEWMLKLGLFAASVLTLTPRPVGIPIAILLAGYSEILAQLLNIVEMEMVGNLLAKRQCKLCRCLVHDFEKPCCF